MYRSYLLKTTVRSHKDQTEIKATLRAIEGEVYWATCKPAREWGRKSRKVVAILKRNQRRLKRALRWLPAETNARGNTIDRSYVGDFAYQFAQSLCRQGYYLIGRWGLTEYYVNDEKMVVECFCEGDRMVITAKTSTAFNAEIRSIFEFHGEPMGVEKAGISMWPA